MSSTEYTQKNTKNFKKDIVCNLSVSLNYIENIYDHFLNLIDNENKLNDKEREILYSYGLDKAKLDLVRLSNAKKSLIAIMKDKKPVNEVVEAV